MKKLFRNDNTEGYNQAQLDQLNNEWEERAKGLKTDEDEYDFQSKSFSDEVARR